jgi:hypothetical protein
MKIIKVIQENLYLTEEQKTDVINRINRIANDPMEAKGCGFVHGCCIKTDFRWNGTKDGHDYWENIYEIMKGKNESN